MTRNNTFRTLFDGGVFLEAVRLSKFPWRKPRKPVFPPADGSTTIEFADTVIVFDLGSGMIDCAQKLNSLPEFDPSLSCEQDPETGELVVFKDGKEVNRVMTDNEPVSSDPHERLRQALFAAHFDLSTRYAAPSGNIGHPSPHTSRPLLPPGPLKLTEHHCPASDK